MLSRADVEYPNFQDATARGLIDRGNLVTFAPLTRFLTNERYHKALCSVGFIMANPFKITARIDEENAIFRVVATGVMDSDLFINRQIECLSAVEKPWMYNRLIDLTDCTGACAYESLHRFAYFWSLRQSQINRTIREAVVTTNGLTVARLPTIELMFRKHKLRVLADIAEAEAWVIQKGHAA